MHEIDEILSEFLVETTEQIEAVERGLVALEQEPGDRDRVAAIFRNVHTIKGTCGFFGFQRMAHITHVGENLLSAVRDGSRAYSSEIATALLQLVDVVREIVDRISATGEEGEQAYEALAAKLERLRSQAPTEASSPAAPTPAATTPPEPEPKAPAAPSAATSQEPADPSAADDEVQAQGVTVDASGFVWTQPLAEGDGDEVAAGETPAMASDPPLAPASEPETRKLNLVDGPPGVATAPGPARPAPPPNPGPAQDKDSSSPARSLVSAGSIAESTVRVDVSLLDSLMDLVGELVLARNQVVRHASVRSETLLTAAAQRLDVVTTELREKVMTTRMRPVRKLFDKVPRVVRDLSMKTDKLVDVELAGREVELDRTIIEAIADPLTHLIRNCVDHGLELPDDREAAGKPRSGKVRLTAAQEGGTVTIEIADDGRGIDPHRVRAGAIDRGLISPDEAADLADADVIEFLFKPGFSTADKVTDISGRGVGLDVVRTNIEEIGGTVEVSSTIGVGTRFAIKIPLTLAIVPALIVSTGDERFAIPQANVVELVRASDASGGSGIELLHGVPVYRLRGRLLPLVFLKQLFELAPPGQYELERPRNIAVVQADKRLFGIVVDGIDDGVEIVVKPLVRQLRETHLFAGATILGDGRVVLILDVLGVAQRSKVLGSASTRAATLHAENDNHIVGDGGELLIVDNGGGGRVAIPLRAITRLEHVDVSRFERVGSREVLQYRGALLPIVGLGDLLPGTGGGAGAGRDDQGEVAHLVVINTEGAPIGLRVDTILDVLPSPPQAPAEPRRHGSLGTLVIDSAATEVLDLSAVAELVPGSRAATPLHAQAV